jgi:uncharacterized protein
MTVEMVTFEALELRVADVSQRIVEGIVVPWGEVSFLTADPKGERFVRGALTRSVQQKGDRIKLFSNHRHEKAIGTAIGWKPGHADGCWGSFRISTRPDGDELLADVADGLLDAFSVGFRPVRERRSDDGVREVLEAELHEVSLVPIGAYDGARVLATRAPAPRFEIPVMPPVNLAPIPVFRMGR